MIVKVDVSSLKSTKPHEFAIRFFLGGLLTVIAGMLAKSFGPAIGGLFLAFPAIFPASVTLIEKHEKQRKQQIGYDGTIRGRNAASLEAAGTSLGALALVLFALILYLFLPQHNPWLTLASASLAWLAFTVGLWLVRKTMHL
jgi:Protein of unknown function (DUF3147)